MKIFQTKFLSTLFIIVIVFSSSCTQSPEISTVPVVINLENRTINDDIEIGSTVQTLLNSESIKINPLDKVEPPVYTVITEALTVNITRVKEEFETEEVIIPFEQQTVRNESLPEKQKILVQSGVNGVQEVTYRMLYEDGELVSRAEVKKTDLVSPRPEIIMVGVQTPFTSIPLNGKLIFLSAGNAWVMEDTTSNRKPILTNGNLDGRILDLSPNGNWLLYTQISADEEKINELWVINLEEKEATPVNLDTDNVIHYAEWIPSEALSVLVSTVEKREVAPGWQANNNLIKLTLGQDGKVIKTENLLESNSGGIYGWWGTEFDFSPTGNQLAFIRPDAIGVVDLDDQSFVVLNSITPYQTRSDWAWVSPIFWSQDGRFLYWVDHSSDSNNTNSELSPLFNLSAIDIGSGLSLTLGENVGMFAYLTEIKDADQTRLFFLQAIFPENSETSRYQLVVSDQDGSNTSNIFPMEGMQGLEPQAIQKSPCDGEPACQLGLIYQGNLWFIEINDQFSSYQITGDGLITRIEWN